VAKTVVDVDGSKDSNFEQSEDGYWYRKNSNGSFDPQAHVQNDDGSFSPYS